jgi:predicted O-linked N-acetylglucosamine transferase (SPINDLY family)
MSGALAQALGLHQAGKVKEAEAIYRRLLAAEPANADALNYLGIARLQQGAPTEAAELFGRALAAVPGHAKAQNNLGNALLALGRRTEARAAFEKAVAADPGLADGHDNLGALLLNEGTFAAAEESLRRALALRPDHPPSLSNLAFALQRQGRPAEAAEVASRALAIQPAFVDARVNLSHALLALGRWAEAEGELRRVLAARPELFEAQVNLGRALQSLGRLDEAETAYRAAVRLRPQAAEALSNLGNVLSDQGRLDEAADAYARALDLAPGLASAFSNRLLSLNYDAARPAEEIFAAHRAYGERLAAPLGTGSAAHANSRDPGRRLKVGYVSPDFRNHSCAFFLLPLIEAHDRTQVEVVCYAAVRAPDATTERFRAAADLWRDVVALDDAALAERVRADGIDILVDCAGHTAGNRLPAFARRPAPVQATWLGYPNTTGMDAIAYRLTDGIADPPGVADRLATETLVRLPTGFLCYRPSVEAPEVAPPPSAAAGFVTFGSFNNLTKVTPPVVATWTRLLDAVPGSRLFVKARALADPPTAKRFLARFAAHGVPAERIDLAPRTPTQRDHLAQYGRVDVALDTFPYNGTTTTCEALWMGVPVVTLAGDRHAGRVGASLLGHLGLGDLTAGDTDAYAALAATLAGDPGRLATLRAGLRPRLAAAPLTDARRFAANIEAAYREMWRTWCAAGTEGSPP